MKKLFSVLAVGVVALTGLADDVYGPFGRDSDIAEDVQQCAPTVYDVTLMIRGKAAKEGDCIAAYRTSDNALCGLGMAYAAGTGGIKCDLVLYSFKDAKIHFKVWQCDTPATSAMILDADPSCDIVAPAPGTIGVHALNLFVVQETFSITFDANGGTVSPTSKTVTYDSTYGELPTPTRTGTSYTYAFDGWYTAASGGTRVTSTSKVTITAAQTLYAHWTATPVTQTYTVTYAAGSHGTGSQQTATKTKDVALALKGAIFTRTGYTQMGWTTSDGGAKAYGLGVSYTANAAVTLYPFWMANTYTVNLDANGGSVSPTSKTVTYDSTYGELPMPIWSDQTFDGWYTAANGGTKITAATKVTLTATQILYAHWTPIGDDSEPIDSQELPYAVYPARGLTIVNGVVTEWDGTGPVDMVIPDGVTEIGQYVFHRAWYERGVHVRSVKFPNSLVMISEGAFVGSHLEAVEFGSGLQKIKHSAFANTRLSGTIVIPSGVYLIGKQAFMGTSIRHVYLPASLSELGRAAFESCTELQGIHFLGNAPLLDLSMADSFVSRSASLFENSNYSAIVHVISGTVGWSGNLTTTLPSKWPVGDAHALAIRADETGTVPAIPSNPENVISGELDAAFNRAQIVVGALYRTAKHSARTLYTGRELAGTLELKIGKLNAKKGVVKVSGTAMLMDGGKVKKVTAKTENLMLMGGTMNGKLAFKAPVGDMIFAMGPDGTFTLVNSEYRMAEATVGGKLPSGKMMFSMYVDDIPSFGEGWNVLSDALVDEVDILVGGNRMDAGKAPTIKYRKHREDGYVWYELLGFDDPAKPNVMGLKLTYTPKTGVFKGAFKVYATNEYSIPEGNTPKLKKYTVNVIGFVADGVGYGEASCKKPVGGPWAVTVE